MSDDGEILATLVEAYGLAPDSHCEPLGNGLINRTLLLHSGRQKFVAQRINRKVFPRPDDVVHNALAIEAHLREQDDYPLQVSCQLRSPNGEVVHGRFRDIRLETYISDSITLQTAETPGQAERAAQAFGRFAHALADLDPGRLVTVLPDFHNLDYRVAQFDTALAEDRVGRADTCREETDFCQSESALASEWERTIAAVPLRICHNDTKLNNLLVDATHCEPVAVIDLDTCMPGRLMTEFGDLVRTCASAEPEDSTRLDRVGARRPWLQALARGYLRGLGGLASKVERQSLALGARVMPYMQGLRFLSDYLDGDRYFSSDYPGHNLDRARNQFALYRSLCEQRQFLEQLVEDGA